MTPILILNGISLGPYKEYNIACPQGYSMTLSVSFEDHSADLHNDVKEVYWSNSTGKLDISCKQYGRIENISRIEKCIITQTENK